MKLCLLSDEDVADRREGWERSLVEEAWRQWQIVSCEERNGGHLWRLTLEVPDEGDARGGINISCDVCPATLNDMYPDGTELVFLECNDIVIEWGRHNAVQERSARVSVNVNSWRSWTDWGYEYDVEIDVDLLEPLVCHG